MRTFLAVLYSSIGVGVLATLVIFGFGADAWSEQFLGMDPNAGPFWPGLTIFGICAGAIALATFTIFYWSEGHDKRLDQQKRKAREVRYGRELTAAEHREEDLKDVRRVADAMSGRSPRRDS
jgi:hypothetical protein